MEDCFCPEREISGDELDFSLWVEVFSLSCLLGGSSGEQLRETGAALVAGEEEEEEEEQLPLSEGEGERWGVESSRDIFLNLVSTALEADEEPAGSSLWSGEILALDDGTVPLRSSDCFLADGEEQAGDLFSLEEGRFSRERSFSIGE